MQEEIRSLEEIERELFERWRGEPPRGFKPFQSLRAVIAGGEERQSLPEFGAFDSLNGLMLVVYQALLQKHAFVPKGIIHVGAHTGSELRLYLTLGFTRVLLVEPNPALQEPLRRRADLYNEMVARMVRLVDASMCGANRWAHPWCVVLPYAAGARDGEASLHCHENSLMTSLLPPSADATDARVVRTVRVPVRRVDSMMSDLPVGWRPEELNALWANVQGTELDVLEGAKRTLAHTDLLAVELSYQQRYKDESLPETVDARLRASGFVPTFGLGVPQGGMRFYARSPGAGAQYQEEEGDLGHFHHGEKS
jgi:FkbM family methyltransferase